MDRNNRIVNIGYIVDGMHFDAAVDCDWDMHNYNMQHRDGKYVFDHQPSEEFVPIELYNLDKRDWDIKIIYYSLQGHRVNYKQLDGKSYDRIINFTPTVHTWVDFDFILEETKKWIAEENES